MNESEFPVSKISIERTILEMHKGGIVQAAEIFPVWAMGLINRLIPFEGCFWGYGTMNDDAHRQGRAFPLQKEDILPFVFLPVDIPQFFDIGVHDQAGMIDALSLHRFDSCSFSAEERAAFASLAPKLVEERREKYLESFMKKDPESCRHRAVSDEKGLLIAVDEGFLNLMKKEWPRWRGPILPEAVQGIFGGKCRYSGKRLVIDATHSNGLLFLRARQNLPVDALTCREHEIARAYASGQSAKEIGKQLNLSPSTVGNHLTAIYKKLGICDKSELAVLFAKYG